MPDAADTEGGTGGSGDGGYDGVGGACSHSAGDAGTLTDDATALDAVAVDRLAPGDAPDDPTCQLPTPAPVTCLTNAPPETPVVRCLGSPRQVGGAQTFVSEMQVHGDTVYWTEQGILKRNDGIKTEVVPIPVSGRGHAIDDDSIYFVSDGVDAGFRRSILRWKLDGTGLTTVAPDISIGIFALDQERIYFNTADGHFMSVAKAGCGTMEPVLAPENVAQIMGMGQALIDATHFYWDEVADGELAIKRVVKGTANVETVAEHLPAGHVLLLQGDGILILSNGHLLEVPKSGGCPRFLGNAKPVGIAADDRDIYWDVEVWDPVIESGRAVYRMPRTGGMAIQVVAPEPQVGNGRLEFRLSPRRVFYARELYHVPSFRIMAVDR